MKPISLTRKTAVFWLLLLLIASGGLFAQPVANFSASETSGCSPSVINFTDLSTGNPTSWKWDLGNGTISTMQNPSASYITAGVYTVKLVVRNNSGADSVVKTNYITIHAAPQVNFSSTNAAGCYPLPVQFTGQASSATGTITTWAWDFGDGHLSNQQNPAYTYTQYGEFNVTLKVTDNHGCINSLQKARHSKINGVTAAYDHFWISRCLPTRLSLFDRSSGNGNMQFKWDFGDGNYNTTIASPTHTYYAGGNYNVKLTVSNDLGCRDSLIKHIYIDTLVTAAFSSSNPVGCKPPFTVNFTSPYKTGNSYEWTFGDGSTSTEARPSHTYADTGSYTVRLKVVNQNGCADSLETEDYVRVKRPFIQFDNLPDSSCAPLTKQFYVANNSGDSIVSYNWDLGNGVTSSLPNPTTTYNNLGYYSIRLIASTLGGCRDTVTVNRAVKLSSKPTASFTAANFSTCANVPIQFNNTSTNATEWEWAFGDNAIETVRNPLHSFKDTGWLMVALIAKNGGCGDTLIRDRYVYVKPAIAKFTAQVNCANPTKVKFTNASIGYDAWMWNFGDGDTTSTQLHPEHVFPGPGTYSVTLQAFNHTTGCNYSLTKEILITSARADFNVNRTTICRRESVRFTSTTDSTKVSRYIWLFGDGSNTNTRSTSVTHTYENPGIYTVKLIVVSLVNCRDTLIRTDLITVNGPTAKFGLPSIGACSNRPYAFSDSSFSDGRNPIVNWQWNFGDDQIQHFSAPPFTHSYDTAGAYFISLKVTDNQGCTDSVYYDRALRVVKMVGGFNDFFGITCTNTQLQFVAPFASPGFTYRWDFGDNTYSSIQRPVKNYSSEGTFTVSLILSNNAGCSDTTIKRDMIRVANPVARFSINDSFRTCPPLLVNFTDSSRNVKTMLWDFGDGTSTTSPNPSHFYSYPGSYTARLTVVGFGGCSSEYTRRIVVNGPRGTISYNATSLCRPYMFTLRAHTQDAVGYTWDFNDGFTVTNTDTIMAHIYENPGKYQPKIVLVDAEGCRVPILTRDSLLAATIRTSFDVDVSNTCDTGLVKLINRTTTNDQIASYRWEFGDGFTSAQQQPEHRYGRDGTYTIRLWVTTITGCTDSATRQVTIRRVPPPSFGILGNDHGCAPYAATFEGQLFSADTGVIAWKWYYGNGDSATGIRPQPYLYSTPGTYTVRATATNRVGCMREEYTIIEILPKPVIDAGRDTLICEGQRIQLHAQGAETYQWLNQNSGCTDCATLEVSPAQTTIYRVEGASSHGCKAIDSVQVTVNQRVRLAVSSSATMCKGESARISASGADQYQWTPSAGLSNPRVANPYATPDSTTTYMVKGLKSGNSCGSDSAFVLVKINPVPTVDAGSDKTTTVGMPVDLDPVVSPDVTDVNWYPTSDLSRSGEFGITVRPTQNTEYTVEARNIHGCVARDKVNVIVGCNGSNLFVPNTFSPNGDGMNDIFYLRGTGIQKVRTIRIFNRWGELVFTRDGFMPNDPAFGWDGKYKGVQLNNDVFVYMIEVICGNGSLVSYNGNVALIN